MKIFLSSLFTLIAFSLVFIPTVFAATDIFLAPADIITTEGERFSVDVSLDPNGAANYTAKVALDFPSDILSVESFQFNENWLPLNQPGYSLIDNDNGVLIRTAGYPGGVSAVVAFGTITFVATSAGGGIISLDPYSLILDAQNQDVVGSTSAKVFVTVKERERIEAPEAPTEEIPKQLFDINLEIDDTEIQSLSDLVARVVFVSFGAEPTPVSMIFSILDENRNIVLMSADGVTVETEEVFTQSFVGAPVVLPGPYTLRLRTLYNINVEDDFEASFTIVPEKVGFNLVAWLIGTLILALITVLVWWIIGKRRKGKGERG